MKRASSSSASAWRQACASGFSPLCISLWDNDFLIQPLPARRLLALVDRHRDRARLMMHHAPGAAEAPVHVCGAEQRRSLDDLDAHDAALVAGDAGGVVAVGDALAGRARQDIAVGIDN